MKPPVILASASPRRRRLLKSLGIRFRVLPSHVPENSTEKSPRRLAKLLALRKARAIAERLDAGFVIGADTIVVLKRHILGKPRDARHAYQILYRLSGTEHEVMTGVAVVNAATGRQAVDIAVSRVRMKTMGLDALLRLSRRHMDKAGAYAIQEKRDPIARVVSGSYDNVVGLPVKLVRRLLKKAGFKARR